MNGWFRFPYLALLALGWLGCPDGNSTFGGQNSEVMEDDADAPDADELLEVEGPTRVWACPGDPGCETAEGPLKAGAARVVVTPLIETFEDLNGNGEFDKGEPFEDLNGNGVWSGVWIAGFSNERFALGVHDELYARILVLEKGDVRVGIISVDWVGLLHDHVLELNEAAGEAGLDLDAVILSSTHNHEGPDTMGIWGPSLFTTGRSELYIAESRDRMVDGLAEAISALVPVRILAGVGQTEGLTHDSRLPEVLDEQVVTLRLERVDTAEPVALVLHWSQHPEALGGSNRYISADFAAFIVAALEEAAPGAVGIYWQGMVGGLMNPLHVHLTDEDGNPIPDASFEKAERMGRLVAETGLADLAESGADATGDGGLRFRRRLFLLPFDNFELGLAAQIGLFRRTVYDENWIEHHVREVFDTENPIDPFIETEVVVLDIGELQIATVPGELYPEAGLVGPNGETYTQDPQDPGADFFGDPCVPPIWSSMRDTPYRIVLGLGQDELGYMIPRCQFDREAPWAYGRSEGQYGEGFSVHPDLVPILNGVLAEELQALNGR